MADQRPSPPRPLDALRRATFAHAAHIDLLRAVDDESGEPRTAASEQTAPRPGAALKPKRKAKRS